MITKILATVASVTTNTIGASGSAPSQAHAGVRVYVPG